jgi:hypothetical protein
VKVNKMSQLYIPKESVKKCHESRDHQDAITVSGVDAVDYSLNPYNGVVQSVEDCGDISPDGRRWRVIMRDTN